MGKLKDLERSLNIILRERNLFRETFEDTKVQAMIKYLNLQKQLYNKGINRDGKQIKTFKARGSDVYAKSTIKAKKRKKQPHRRATFKDTGDAYKTYNIKVFREKAILRMDTYKDNFNVLRLFKVKQLIGLTPENKTILIKKIVLSTLRRVVRKKLFSK